MVGQFAGIVLTVATMAGCGNASLTDSVQETAEKKAATGSHLRNDPTVPITYQIIDAEDTRILQPEQEIAAPAGPG